MQTKEKKWLEVEAYLLPYYVGDKKLEEKMQELKMETGQMSRISNVVAMNARLQNRIDREK
jgi:hypothetical protein